MPTMEAGEAGIHTCSATRLATGPKLTAKSAASSSVRPLGGRSVGGVSLEGPVGTARVIATASFTLPVTDAPGTSGALNRLSEHQVFQTCPF